MKQVLLYLAVTVGLTGCGVLDMPDKMDGTNKKMDSMVGKMDNTNAGITKTNQAVHKQTLAGALKDIRDSIPKEIFPEYMDIPTHFLPGAKIFAEEAEPKELVELAYVWLKGIKDQQPDMKRWKEGLTEEQVQRASTYEKLWRLTALKEIAALAPQGTIDEMVKTEILKGGRYQAAAYETLALRADFIDKYRIKQSLFQASFDTPGKFEEAVKQIENVEYVAAQPFVKKIKLHIRFPIKKMKYDAVIDPKSMVAWNWEFVHNAFETQLGAAWKDDPRTLALRKKVTKKYEKWKHLLRE
jgi:hypothetical protein